MIFHRFTCLVFLKSMTAKYKSITTPWNNQMLSLCQKRHAMASRSCVEKFQTNLAVSVLHPFNRSKTELWVSKPSTRVHLVCYIGLYRHLNHPQRWIAYPLLCEACPQASASPLRAMMMEFARRCCWSSWRSQKAYESSSRRTTGVEYTS